MSLNRKELERETRKKLILASALKVFKDLGLERATMDEIAKVAGFGKATLYYYYHSKEEIFNTILLEGWKNMWTSLKEFDVAGKSPRKAFISLLKRIAELVNEDRPLFEFLFFAPKALPAEYREKGEWRVYQNRLYDLLTLMIEAGIKEGQFPQMDTRLVLKAMGGIFHGLVFLGDDRDTITEAEIEEMLGTLLRKDKQAPVAHEK
ncbi:MAG: TetR/AcrR family transcriptional regulator [Candidatus Marinimicrobia bacterium]|nr:TetR/AcrR family transcriptional regulator [Candidatus Neomarinimicrobiota bacterium]MCF7903784.1 TetR/AcrR family transcriptional regulator [Candidatus Neomarinimicrobiota bacterium]